MTPTTITGNRNGITIKLGYHTLHVHTYTQTGMAEGDLHSYICDDSSQESASDSEDFLEGKLISSYASPPTSTTFQLGSAREPANFNML